MSENTEKARKCPWCGEVNVAKISQLKKPYGEITERTCSNCGKILAAYLGSEGQFLPKIRSY